MSKSVIEIDNRLTGIGIAAERAKVIIGDLQQDYLGQDIHGIEDAWRLMSHTMIAQGLRLIL